MHIGVAKAHVLRQGMATVRDRTGPIRVRHEIIQLQGVIPIPEVPETGRDPTTPTAIPGVPILQEETIVAHRGQALIAVRAAADHLAA